MRSSMRAAMALLLCTAPAWAAGSFDGTYSGPWHVTVNGNTGACARAEQADVHIAVKDNQFNIRWNGEPVPVTVASDGTIKGDAYIQARALSLHVTVSGKASPTGFEADAGTSSCMVHMTMRKT